MKLYLTCPQKQLAFSSFSPRKSKKIKYTHYNIEKNPEGKKKYQQAGGKGVLVVKIGSKIIKGYNKGAILAALE